MTKKLSFKYWMSCDKRKPERARHRMQILPRHHRVLLLLIVCTLRSDVMVSPRLINLISRAQREPRCARPMQCRRRKTLSVCRRRFLCFVSGNRATTSWRDKANYVKIFANGPIRVPWKMHIACRLTANVCMLGARVFTTLPKVLAAGSR
jgi:hypothetical protein